MSQWNPCKRNDFIRRLRRLGFTGLYSGTKHHFMLYEQHRLTIPTNAEYSVPQLRMIREVESIVGRQITADEWNNLS
jgi:predicted RNA binding protein YcfA (HicA-like mRNA interferase family)